MTPTPRRLGWVVALRSTAYFMVVLDSVVVITALPRMQRDLHVSLAALQWDAERLRHRLCRGHHLWACTVFAGLGAPAAVAMEVGCGDSPARSRLDPAQ